MNLRISLARFLIRLGKFIESTAILTMKPDDLVEFSRQSYATLEDVEAWGEDDLVDSGLSEEERNLINAVPESSGKLLLLGVGGGREAIPFARMGFQVTGVDFVPAMVEKAKKNAVKREVQIQGLVQEISQLDLPPESFDVIWLSRSMYSAVPTRTRRVEMIRRITKSLKPGGILLCQFHAGSAPLYSPRGKTLRRMIAAALGNLSYEDGDSLWLNVEFIHIFESEQAVKSEIEAGGLSVIQFHTNQTRLGSAVCQKPGKNTQ